MHKGLGFFPSPAISFQCVIQAVNLSRRVCFHCTPNDVWNIEKTNSALKKRFHGYLIGRIHRRRHGAAGRDERRRRGDEPRDRFRRDRRADTGAGAHAHRDAGGLLALRRGKSEASVRGRREVAAIEVAGGGAGDAGLVGSWQLVVSSW